MLFKAVIWFMIIGLGLTSCTAFPMDPAPSGSNPGKADPNSPVTSDSPGAETSASPLDALPGEDKLGRAGASLTESEILVMESFPVQIMLTIKGTLPTPCHHLRAKISAPDADHNIQVEVYSLVDPDEICIQVLQEFDARFPLGAFDPGNYKVLINGQKVAEFSQ